MTHLNSTSKMEGKMVSVLFADVSAILTIQLSKL